MRLCRALMRKKQDNLIENEPSQLIRALGTFDLVALGVGSTLGVGIYVLAGQVAKDVAGPAVVISFLLAAIVTAFAGLSYAEFGARVPKAGSAYIYSYYCVGEFTAFIIGWSLILEYSIGAASVAKGISSYIDSLTGNALRDSLTDLFPLNHYFLSSYIDFFAMALCLALCFALALGVKESSIINNIFTTCNVCVVIFFIVAGSITADFSNWNIAKENMPENKGEGGFAPFGLSGIIHGAAICFYGFVGFDCIATTGEEVRNPQKAIPLSIVLSLGVILAAYLGVSSVLTLMLPYYLQDPDAPIPHAFQLIGWHNAKWIISIGALFGLFASLFGALFPLPRIIYAMANDGLLYKWLGKINQKFHTPLMGTLISGILTSIIAAFFNLQQLVGLNAIGTLVTYTLISVCVLVLRYQPNAEDENENEQTGLLTNKTKVTCRQLLYLILSFRRFKTANATTSALVIAETCVFCVFSISLSFLIVFYGNFIYDLNVIAISFVSIHIIIMILIMLSISMQPTSSERLFFKMPLVPLIPCLSIFANIYLMIVLDGNTWIRFIVAMLIGNKMYREGIDLEGIVDDSYAFLEGMPGAGNTMPRNRDKIIYTKPRFNSVRDIPEYDVPRTRQSQRDPFDGGNWIDTRKMSYPDESQSLRMHKKEEKGSYLLQRTLAMERQSKQTGPSMLLKRTNFFVEATNRFKNPVKEEETVEPPAPPPLPNRKSSNFSNRPTILPPPVPPPMPTLESTPQPTIVRALELKKPIQRPKDSLSKMPDLADVTKARTGLRRVEPRVFTPKQTEELPETMSFKEKLERIVGLQNDALKRWDNVYTPPVLEAHNQNDEKLTQMTEEKYKTKKTMKKKEMQNALSQILLKGPPQNPSFRSDSEFEKKRQKVAQKFLSSDNQTITDNNKS